MFDIWRNERISAQKVHAVLKYLTDTTNIEDLEEALRKTVRKKIISFCAQLLDKWKKSNRCKKTFLQQNKKWLDGCLTIEVRPDEACNVDDVTGRAGRPRKEFAECSYSTKKRKIQKLLQESTSQELSFATQVSLWADGKRDAAKILKHVSSPTASPLRATKAKQRLTSPNNLPIKMTNEKALAIYIDNKFTKYQYIDIQHTSKMHNANIYPPYNKLLEAKKECYPANIEITEISGTVSLQSLVDHTIRRLTIALQDVLKSQVDKYDPSNLQVIFKWGCDGASGYSRYHQAFQDKSHDDSFLFLIMLSPLRIVAGERVLWQNPAPSSTRSCRPIKVIFHKETTAFVKKEVDNVRQQIEKLVPTQVMSNELQYIFTPILTLTMIDGKTCSTLTDTASQSCHVCKATPKMMNNLDLVRARPTNTKALQLGMSSLHAWIKCLECILHIAYRLDIKKWAIQQEHKASVDKRKKEIQEQLRTEMHILVDLPKQGYGSSNTGNVARAFFHNPKKASQITQVSEELIKRFGTILRTICSGFAVNIPAFEQFTAETAELYVRNYNWYYMPQSVHKILIHGALIMREAIMPIGILSEEAQESRNKDVRNYREFHARKFSRKENVEDILHMLLVSSDPLITSVRKIKSKPRGQSFPNEVIALLEVPQDVEE